MGKSKYIYNSIDGIWKDYYSTIVLTEKMSLYILKQARKQQHFALSAFISKYSIVKFLLTKEMFIQCEIPKDVLVFLTNIVD